jgi:ABC-type polysaccharide/polyol phosphate export permease
MFSHKVYLVNALRLAWFDTKVRYKKSYLGPFWYTISNFFGIVALSFIWAELMHENLRDFVPKLAVGLVLWQLISGVLTESPRLLNENSATLRNIRLPMWFLPARLMGRQVINLLHNFLLIGVIFFYLGINPVTQPIWLVSGLLLVLVFLFMTAFVLAGMGARYRDIRYAIETIMPLVFFVSPVIFKTEALSHNLIWYNPISYLIEVVRLPLLGSVPPPDIYFKFLLMLLAMALVLMLYYRVARIKLSYWVN